MLQNGEIYKTVEIHLVTPALVLYGSHNAMPFSLWASEIYVY